jgi:hypothetical protein
LREQREIIQNVADLNQQISSDLVYGKAKIQEMSRREFWYKIGLYFVIIALGLTIVVMLVVRLINMFKTK